MNAAGLLPTARTVAAVAVGALVLAVLPASAVPAAPSAEPAGAAPTAASALAPACTIVGTADADVLVGGPGDDVICGRGGADRLVGRGGADQLRGGPGADRLLGRVGDDLLLGGSDDDLLRGGGGADRLRAGRGDDSLGGGGGDDVLRARDGAAFVDQVRCGGGTDEASADPEDVVAADCETGAGNSPPVAVDDTFEGEEDTPLELPATGAGSPAANDTDADGDTLVVTAVSGAVGGTVEVSGGTITFTPEPDLCGQGAGGFDYTVGDGNGGTDQGRVTVDLTCTPDVPVAVDDEAAVDEDAPATAVDVLANDTDVDGSAGIESVTQPDHGTVTVTGGGSGLTYEPDPNYCNQPPGTAPDTFTYTLTGGSTATVEVSVVCVDDPPVAVDDTAEVNEDDPARPLDVLANDTDPDDALAIASVTQPDHGAVAITGGGSGLTYQPDPDYCNNPPGDAPDTFTYTLAGGSTADVAVTVHCVRDEPLAVTDAATVDEDDGPTAVPVLANDNPRDGGPLTITAVTQPAHGTVVITGGGTGLTYEPDPNYCNDPPGTERDTFKYTLNGGSAANVYMTVRCVDDPPVAVDDAAIVDEDDPATPVDVLANDTDIDGGPRTITSVSPPVHGTVVITGGGTGLTYEPDPDYCNNPPGTAPDTFTYTLDGGSIGDVAILVNCADDAPVAVDDSATVVEDSGPSPIDVLGNDTDVDGGPMSVASATDPAHGTVVVTGGGTGLAYAPDPDYCNQPPGGSPDTFTYTLAPGGDTATVSVTVTCVDDAPRAIDDAATVAEDAAATTVDVLANDTDIDGGPMTVGAVTQPSNGAVAVTGGGSGVSYTPDPDYCNDPPGTSPDTFTYTLAPGGSTATVRVNVTCVDDPPVAVPDSATVAEDAAATAINVLLNDQDLDGGPMSIASATQPNDGTVVITGGGTGLTYEPDPNYCNQPPGTAPDTFSYTLAPGGSTATVSVTVTCVDDAPTAVDDAETVSEDPPGAVFLDVLANDTDPDGGTKSVTAATQPGNGVVMITAGGAGVTYLPDQDYCNTQTTATPKDTFSYTVTGGDTATVTVTVTCVDDAPVAADDAATVDQDDPATSIDVLANDTDIDGGPMSVASASDPAHGTVVVTGGGAGLTYQPDAGYCNTQPAAAPKDTFTYTLNGGSTATVTVTVVCADVPPTAVDDAATVTEDAGATAIDVLANDTDPDGGPKSVASVTQPTNGTAAVSGGGSGVTYTPDGDFCGTDSFTYSLAPGGSTATVSVTVTCVDDAPTPVDDAATVTEDAAATAIDVLANDTDPDGGPNTIISASDPTNGTVVLTGGTPGAHTGLTYQPDPNYCNDPPGTAPDTFTYLSNGGPATVSVTVTCVNDSPIADDESFSGADAAVGNTALVVDDPTDGAPAEGGPHKTITGDILDGDTDVDGPSPLILTAGTFPTNDGGTVTVEADGDFVFTPAAGTSCNDTSDFFDYTVTDAAGASDTGRVTIEIAGCVWYVSNNAPGDAGTSTAPFDTLAQAETASAAGHTIYLFDGDDTTTGYASGIDLKDDQRLLGQTETLQVGGDVLAAGTAGARPTITNTDADVITLASGNVLRGLELDPSGTGGGIAGGVGDNSATIADVRIVDGGAAGTEPGLDLNGTTGTFTISDLTVDNTAATGATAGSVGVRLNNAGAVVIADTGTVAITTSGAKALDAAGTDLTATFDTVTVTGSGSGGVRLVDNSGVAEFSDLSLTTTASATGAFVVIDPTGGPGSLTTTVPAAGTAEVNATGGPAVVVDAIPFVQADLAFDTVSSTGSASNGVVLRGLSGTFAAPNGLISGHSATGFAVDGGGGTVTYGGAIGNGAGETAFIGNRTGGDVTFSGPVTDTGDAGGGISLTGNTGGSTLFSGATKTLSTGDTTGVAMTSSDGHTLTFSGGGLAITTTTGNGLNAANSGTLVVSGPGNTIDSTTGRALSVTQTDIGSADLTFQRISSDGAPNGIVLDATGTAGNLVVTGNGGTCTAADTAGCSGGTIANSVGADDAGTLPAGAGIVLRNTTAPSLTRMRIHHASNYGIRGADVSGFTLANSVVHGNLGNNATTPFDDSGILFTNLTGSASITDTHISGGFEDNLRVTNTVGSLQRITITNATIGANSTTDGNDAVLLESAPTAGALLATVNGSTFTGARGDLLQFNHDGVGPGDLVLTNNTFSNNHPAIATGGGGLSLFQGGSAGSTTMSVTGNSFRDAVGPGVLVVKGAGTTIQQGVFANNTIGVAGTANSGSKEGSGLKLQVVGGGTMAWTVDNNQIRGYNNFGIEVLAGGGAVAQSGALETRITNNTVNEPGNTLSTQSIPKQGVHYNIGTVPGDTFQACAHIVSNTLHDSGADAQPPASFNFDVRLRQRQSTTIRLPDYTGGNTDTTAVATFVNDNNSVGTSTIASHNSPPGGGFTGGSSACATPPLP